MWIDIPLRHAVFQAKLQRIHADCTGQVICQRFGHKSALRDTIRAHRARSRAVGVHRPAFRIQYPPILVVLFEHVGRVGGNCVPVRRISTLIGPRTIAPADERAVRQHQPVRLPGKWVPHTRAGEHIFPRQLHLDGMAVQFDSQPCGKRLDEHILLVAEPASDVGLDDSDSAPRNAQRLPDHTAHNMRNLRGRYDHNFAVFLIRKAVNWLQMAMLHRRNRILCARLNHAGQRFRILIGQVAQPKRRVCKHICFAHIGVQRGRLRRAQRRYSS